MNIKRYTALVLVLGVTASVPSLGMKSLIMEGIGHVGERGAVKGAELIKVGSKAAAETAAKAAEKTATLRMIQEEMEKVLNQSLDTKKALKKVNTEIKLAELTEKNANTLQNTIKQATEEKNELTKQLAVLKEAGLKEADPKYIKLERKIGKKDKMMQRAIDQTKKQDAKLGDIAQKLEDGKPLPISWRVKQGLSNVKTKAGQWAKKNPKTTAFLGGMGVGVGVGVPLALLANNSNKTIEEIEQERMTDRMKFEQDLAELENQGSFEYEYEAPMNTNLFRIQNSYLPLWG